MLTTDVLAGRHDRIMARTATKRLIMVTQITVQAAHATWFEVQESVDGAFQHVATFGLLENALHRYNALNDVPLPLSTR